MVAISVIICAHNPRRDYLDKVLAALQAQSVVIEQWELILIDNKSEKLLAQEIDLTWHPQAYHIREEQLGLTSARLRGIAVAQADLLVFVDDDNILELDFLEVTLQISRDFPFLGAWGGRIEPCFEVTPEEWTKPYWRSLAIRHFNDDKWSNLVNNYETTPCGAGLCVRKNVAQQYAHLVTHDPRRLLLGRNGNILTSGEDSDLAFTACDIGLGTGIFTSLKLTHLIPANRVSEQYLLRLVEGIAYSHIILHSFRAEVTIYRPSWQAKLLEYYRYLKMNPRQKRFYQAEKRGLLKATSLTNKTPSNQKIPPF